MSHSQEVAHKKLSSSLGFSDDTELDLPMLALNAAARVDRLSAELAASNERIRELEENLNGAEKRCTFLDAGWDASNAQLAAEREVSDKLEKALRYYANGKHSVRLSGAIDWKAGRVRLESLGFECVGEWPSGDEEYVEGGTVAENALAEVGALRAREGTPQGSGEKPLEVPEGCLLVATLPDATQLVPKAIHPLDSTVDCEEIIERLRHPPNAIRFNDSLSYYAHWWDELLAAASRSLNGR